MEAIIAHARDNVMLNKIKLYLFNFLFVVSEFISSFTALAPFNYKLELYEKLVLFITVLHNWHI